MTFASTTSILQRKVNNINELRGLDMTLSILLPAPPRQATQVRMIAESPQSRSDSD
jgi:hypothetical protein